MHGDDAPAPVGPRRNVEGPCARSLAPHRKQNIMAGRILNRRELRKQADQAEQIEQEEPVEQEAEEGADDEAEARPRKKARAKAPAVKKPRKKKESPAARPLGRVRCRHE